MDLKTRLENGRVVSTVTLDSGVIETMVFTKNSWAELWVRRTRSELIAQCNHRAGCEWGGNQ